MAQEPSADARGFSPRPGPWQSDPSNGSVSLGEGNVTGNTTQSTGGDEQSPYNYMIIIIALAVMFALFGLLGNGTVIWLLGFRVRRNPFSVYILNLAVADFLYLLCIIAILLVSVAHTAHLKVYILPVLSTSYVAGMSLLMTISTERCVSALFPIWYRSYRPLHLSAIVCAAVWGLSLCLGTLWLFCDFSMEFPCNQRFLVYIVLFFLTLLEVCASSLTLLIRIHCGSSRRHATKLYRVILLAVLAFLVFGLPLNLGFLITLMSQKPLDFYQFIYIFYIPSVLNSTINPVIYFFVGRQSQRPGRKSLQEVLQSALTEDM